jgi:hypothetical protein
VEAGLWDEVDGGYQVHDFLEYNPAATNVKERREADRIRKETYKNPRGKSAESNGNLRGSRARVPDPTRPKKEEIQEISSEASSEPVVAFLKFPIIGPGDGVWVLSEAQVLNWEELFPGLDIGAEARKALAWIGAHKSRRKTSKGMDKFLVAWLTRAVDRGGPRMVPERRSAEVMSEGSEWVCSHEPHCLNRRSCELLQAIAAEKQRTPREKSGAA